MTRKLVGICRFCKNVTVDIYGERCIKANYRDHGGGYGNSWESNECKHDQHHSPKKDLFSPVDNDGRLLSLEKETLEQRGIINQLKTENQTLRNLIRSST